MSLHELAPTQYATVHGLFQEQRDHHLFCAGMLAGKIPGRVIVDNPDRPRSGFVLKGTSWCYLGGDPENASFNEALASALAAREYVGENAWGLLCFIPSDGWRTLLQTLVAERPAIATPRQLYLATRDHSNTPPAVAGGYTVHYIDESLPANVEKALPDDVQNVLDLRRRRENPDQWAFGFAALHGQQCVAWSMVDCIVERQGEIGLFTHPAHRRHGLGMALSGATLQYGLAHGLSQIHWDVIAHNAPSIRMAEKHGLLLSREYEQHLIVFGKMAYPANVAYHHLDNERFEDVLEACRNLVEVEGGAKYAHYLSGVAYAALGRTEAALRQLHLALDHGWDDLSELEGSRYLQELQTMDEWTSLRARIPNLRNG